MTPSRAALISIFCLWLTPSLKAQSIQELSPKAPVDLVVMIKNEADNRPVGAGIVVAEDDQRSLIITARQIANEFCLGQAKGRLRVEYRSDQGHLFEAKVYKCTPDSAIPGIAVLAVEDKSAPQVLSS